MRRDDNVRIFARCSQATSEVILEQLQRQGSASQCDDEEYQKQRNIDRMHKLKYASREDHLGDVEKAQSMVAELAQMMNGDTKVLKATRKRKRFAMHAMAYMATAQMVATKRVRGLSKEEESESE